MSFSGTQKMLLVVGMVILLGGAYFFYSSRAGTTINLTLTTNPDLETGLVGHWTFDGEHVDWSSTTAEIRDRSGNNVHGDAESGITARSLVPGPLGQALFFGGGEFDRVGTDFTGSEIYNFPDGAKFSLAGWFSRSDIESNDYLVAKSNSWVDGYSVSIDPFNNFLYFNIGNQVDDAVSLSSNEVFVTSEWHHFVAVWGDTFIELYVDGILSNRSESNLSQITTASSSQTGFSIGDRNGYGAFEGSLDDIRIYNRALSADEVKRLYQLGATTKIAETITSNTTLETGLVGHWTFDGQDVDWSSTTAEIRDRSGSNFRGDASGGMSATTSPTRGVLGQAMSFDGINDQIQLFPSDTLDGTTQGTVAAWARDDGSGYHLVFISAGSIGGCSECFEIGYSNGDMVVWASNSVSNRVFEGYVNVDKPSAWNHLVYTADASGNKFYVNGTQVTPTYASGTASSVFFISTYNTEGTEYYISPNTSEAFDGDIDDVRIYNRALSADEVKRLYQLGATTKIAETITSNPTLETGLVGHWTFDGPDVDWSSTTAEIRDRSGNNNHGDTQGGMSAGTSPTRGVLGQGITFDGYDDYIRVPDSPSLDMTDDLTLVGWIRPARSYARIITKRSGPLADGYDIMLYWDNLSLNPMISSAFDETAAPVPANEWSHFTMTKSGVNLSIYVNGTLTNSWSTAPATIVANSEPLLIGGAFSFQFEGSMDDVRIYNRALSADEVQRLYELGR